MTKKWILTWMFGCWLVPLPAQNKTQASGLQRVVEALAQQVEKHLPVASPQEVVLLFSLEAEKSILGREKRMLLELERLLVYRLESGNFVQQALRVLESKQGSGLLQLVEDRSVWKLRCAVDVRQGLIQLVGDLTPVKPKFWQRFVQDRSRSGKHHLVVSEQADREILMLLEKSELPMKTSGYELRELLVLPKRVLDLGFGEIDGIPGMELALLLEEAVEVYTFQGEKPRLLASRPLKRLPEAKIQSRDPSGVLLVVDFNQDGIFEIFYKAGNRAYGEVLSWDEGDFIVQRKLAEAPLCLFYFKGRPTLVYGQLEPGTNFFRPQVQISDINAATGRIVEFPQPYYSLRCWQKQLDSQVEIALVDVSGRLVLGNLEQADPAMLPSPMVGQVGVAIALVDFEGDGNRELVLSEWGLTDLEDSIQVRSDSALLWQTKQFVGGVVAMAGKSLGSEICGVVFAAKEPESDTTRIYCIER